MLNSHEAVHTLVRLTFCTHSLKRDGVVCDTTRTVAKNHSLHKLRDGRMCQLYMAALHLSLADLLPDN